MLAQRLRHDPLVEISPKPSFERLISRIHAEADMPGGQHSQDPRRAGPGTAGRLAGWFKALRAGPASPRLAAVCATTLLALAIPLLLDAWPPTRQPAYHTVADAGSLGSYTRDDLRVVFAGQTTKQEISHLIRAVHGDIVDGPNPAGVYTVRLAGGEQGGVERALAQLRASQSVVFAEPALPLAGKPGGGG
jgi:hypothetical protein